MVLRLISQLELIPIMLNFCQLNDLGFQGPPFTWEGIGVKERIDCGRLAFPNASVIHLHSLNSYHKALLLKFQEDSNQPRYNKNLFSFWLGHPNGWAKQLVSSMRILMFGIKLALAICSIERDESLSGLKEKIDTCTYAKKIFGKTMSQHYPKKNCIGSKNLDVNGFNLEIIILDFITPLQL
ncbi:hypothetical protein CR513_04618, partial [Mucuna pruriens]